MTGFRTKRMQILEETPSYILKQWNFVTYYDGCQCYGDCGCKESFKPSEGEWFLVKKKTGKIKTSTHSTLKEARDRITFLVKNQQELIKKQEELVKNG